MFSLKWFPKWSRENPKDIYGPAILVGVLGCALFVAALIVTWGNPAATSTMQTGPRGAGMGVTKFVSDLNAPDPTIEAYFSEEVYVPEEGEVLAKDVYENVQVLGDLTEDNFNRVMGAITAWVSPEQGCAYCHGDGDLETYGSDDLYTKVVSRRMIQMTQFINEEYDAHVAPAGVNCYTCHRGENVPSDIWFKRAPVLENVKGWSANQNFATAQSSSTSLPSDALEKYLLEDEIVAVHDLEPRAVNEGTPKIQHTERTYSLMNYYANSLGVNCTFCHNTRAFYDGEQVTPQWSVAFLARSMVQELNNDYLVPLKDTYPETRLGPLHKDAPKTACKTCHKGVYKPLGGMDMITDWPELATTEAPVYE